MLLTVIDWSRSEWEYNSSNSRTPQIYFWMHEVTESFFKLVLALTSTVIVSEPRGTHDNIILFQDSGSRTTRLSHRLYFCFLLPGADLTENIKRQYELIPHSYQYVRWPWLLKLCTSVAVWIIIPTANIFLLITGWNFNCSMWVPFLVWQTKWLHSGHFWSFSRRWSFLQGECQSFWATSCLHLRNLRHQPQDKMVPRFQTTGSEDMGLQRSLL